MIPNVPEHFNFKIGGGRASDVEGLVPSDDRPRVFREIHRRTEEILAASEKYPILRGWKDRDGKPFVSIRRREHTYTADWKFSSLLPGSGWTSRRDIKCDLETGVWLAPYKVSFTGYNSGPCESAEQAVMFLLAAERECLPTAIEKTQSRIAILERTLKEQRAMLDKINQII